MTQRTAILDLNLALLQNALEVVPDAAVALDDSGTVLFANARFCETVRLSSAKLIGSRLDQLMPDSREWIERKQFLSMVRFGELDSEDVRLVTSQGQRKVWTRTSLMKAAGGEGYRVVLSIRDVTDRSLLEDRLRTLSLTDELTGLHNRRYLRSVLPFDEERSCRFGQLLACTFIDVDRFKEINDRLGHSVGDEALKWIAANLKINCRKLDTVCRWGGDEFVIVSHIKEPEGLRVLLDRLVRKVASEALVVDSHKFNVSITCGSAYGNCVDGVKAMALIEKADELMLRGKDSGRGRFFMAEVLGS